MTVVHQENNVGADFIFTVYDSDGVIVNLATATTMTARFRAEPGVAAFERAGTLLNDGSDGKFRYKTITGDLTPDGNHWERQGFVIVPGLGEFYTDAVRFIVKPNL